MKTKIIGVTAAALLLGTAALAGPVDDIVAEFKALGYSEIETEQDGDKVWIEGELNGMEREVVYDLASNMTLSDKIEAEDDGGPDEEKDDEGEKADGDDD